ncbi:MAG: DUF3108 domain-containing protein [Nevskiales bacterium]|nr:DUF3108 domain-containing protein [Nevskiales bacterium]
MRWVLPGLFLALSLNARAAESTLPELQLTYGVTWNSLILGEATITLGATGEPDCYRYESLTRPVGLVRMFYGKPRETSEFCIVAGRVVPKRFSFVNTKHEDQNFTLEFDPVAGRVRSSRGDVREIPSNAQDRFGLQQAVRLWVLEHAQMDDPGTVEFAMVDDDRIKVYRFAITAREEVEVAAGRFATLRVQRVDDPNKSITFWLSPARHYMPVKVEQVKDGKTDLRMELQ